MIPLGLDLTPFLQSENLRGQLRRELNIAQNTPIIGIVARLVPIKAIHLLLEAASQVIKTQPNAVFLIVGDGEMRGALEQQTQTLNLSKNVRFLGFRSDLPRLYAGFDVNVLCSLNEGLPVAVIESLACARPVVATDVGGVGDLIAHQKTGWLCPTQDVKALAEGICYALKNPTQAQAWGSAGRKRVYPALDIARLCDDLEALYEELWQAKQ